MAKRIAVFSKKGVPDTRAEVRARRLNAQDFSVDGARVVDIYTLDGDTELVVQELAEMLHNPVTQEVQIGEIPPPDLFDGAIEVGFLPGVTDNVGNTAQEIADDAAGSLKGHVHTSQLTFLRGPLKAEDVARIAGSLSNPVIHRVTTLSEGEYRQHGLEIQVPRVKLQETKASLVDILHADDLEMQRIGKLGIFDHKERLTRKTYDQRKAAFANDPLRLGDLSEDTRNPESHLYFMNIRRGPLALDLTYMKAIQKYFLQQGRNPTDVELEVLAQTWSEHCRHTIFADPIDNDKDGLFKTYIKAATERVLEERAERGLAEFCLSVFQDNAGMIVFDEDHLVTHKVETHNSPSALDPFGGSVTGIVGVNRDAIGVGMGAKPIINIYGFCFAYPEDTEPIFKGPNKTQPMLSPRRILEGVVEGVNVGGNCSGIPTPQGFVTFDPRYKGKPLVFVGTLGIIPREVAGKKMYEKKAEAGDLIVMVGGRVGKDGIHGATFSSEAMDTGSPVTAVQIGDPITQKKLSDALIKEARDRGLYRSITDNGAGGLSCSVYEMAKESGGAEVDLDAVPLKYPGLRPDETLISESQERMTLAVPKEKLQEFLDLMKRRGVEATVIGRFTNSGRAIATYHGETVMDLDMDFLHGGLPPRPMQTTYTPRKFIEPSPSGLEDLTQTLHDMLARKNIASKEFISRQYDHEVQGGSVLKPLQGKGRVNGNTTITRPILSSHRGVVLSQCTNPSYGDIDMYNMAACSIDTAINNAVVAGADPDRIALLDNFCWCSSNDPERLGQLKQACMACYDVATRYGTPFISGKDSMFNDFKGYDEQGNPIKISVPPTLLISSIGIMDDTRKAVSLDSKVAGDLVYILGETNDELGGSEYYAMRGEQERGSKFIGENVPIVDMRKNARMRTAYHQAFEEELVASAVSVEEGGLAVALSKTAMGGMLGMDISLAAVPGKARTEANPDEKILFSQSQGRILATVNPAYQARFEELMKESGTSYAVIGKVRSDSQFNVTGVNDQSVVKTTIDSMLTSYRSTFEDF